MRLPTYGSWWSHSNLLAIFVPAATHLTWLCHGRARRNVGNGIFYELSRLSGTSYLSPFDNLPPSKIGLPQKPAFWRRPILKPHPERVIKIPEQIILVRNLTAGSVRWLLMFVDLSNGIYLLLISRQWSYVVDFCWKHRVLENYYACRGDRGYVGHGAVMYRAI